jgi:hypothetical protein
MYTNIFVVIAIFFASCNAEQTRRNIAHSTNSVLQNNTEFPVERTEHFVYNDSISIIFSEPSADFITTTETGVDKIDTLWHKVTIKKGNRYITIDSTNYSCKYYGGLFSKDGSCFYYFNAMIDSELAHQNRIARYFFLPSFIDIEKGETGYYVEEVSLEEVNTKHSVDYTPNEDGSINAEDTDDSSRTYVFLSKLILSDLNLMDSTQKPISQERIERYLSIHQDFTDNRNNNYNNSFLLLFNKISDTSKDKNLKKKLKKIINRINQSAQ